MSFKFIRTPYESKYPADVFDDMTVTVEVGHDASWPDLLEAFKGFLQASGYSLPKGDLEFVNNDPIKEPSDEDESSGD